MRQIKIAKRYAKALFSLAVEQNTLEPIAKDMQLIGDTVRESEDLIAMLKSPIVKKRQKINVLQKIFEGKTGDLTMRFLTMVVQKGREEIIGEITHQFSLFYNQYHNIVEAEVVMSFEDENIVQDLKNILEQYTQANIKITSKVDPSLIGGFVLKFGDKQYDTSLRTKLHKLRTKLSENLYIKKIPIE